MISRRDAVKLGVGTAGVAAIGGAAFLWRHQDADPLPALPSGNETSSGTPSGSDGAPPIIANVIGDNGLDLVLEGMHVSAPAGVADAGTSLQLTIVAHPAPESLNELGVPIGPGLDIVLGNGLQPNKPITISADLSVWSELTEDISDQSPLVLVSRSELTDTPLVSLASWDPTTQTATAITDHLSGFGFVRLDIKQWLTDILLDMMGLTFPTPACAYQPHYGGNTTYRILQSNNPSAWPCIREQNGQIIVEIHSNSILPWVITTTPPVVGNPSGEFMSIGPHLSRFYSGFFGVFGDSRSLAMPGNTLTFSFPHDPPPSNLQLEMSPGIFAVSILLWAVESLLDVIFRGKKEIVDELLDGFESLPCLVDVIRTTNDITDEAYFTGIVSTILSCIEALIEEGTNKLLSVVGKSVLTVVGILVSGAGIVAGAIIGAMATLTDTDQFSFAITTEAAAPSGDATQCDPWTDSNCVPNSETQAYEGSRTTLEIESWDGFKANLTISVGPLTERRGVQPPSCSINFMGSSESEFYFKSREINLNLESVSVNGFNWPAGRQVRVHLWGYPPCSAESDDSTGDYWTYNLDINSSRSITVVRGVMMTPKHPDGDFSFYGDSDDLIIVIEDATESSCSAITSDSGFSALYDTNLIRSTRLVAGCQLIPSTENTVVIEDPWATGFTPVPTLAP